MGGTDGPGNKGEIWIHGIDSLCYIDYNEHIRYKIAILFNPATYVPHLQYATPRWIHTFPCN